MSDRNSNFITEFTEVFTRDSGWQSIGEVKNRQHLLIFDEELKLSWLMPTIIDHYWFKGIIKKIETDSETLFLKPSTEIVVKEKAKVSKDIVKGDLITRKSQWQMVHTVKNEPWEGKMYRLFFGEDLVLPIRFGSDYCFLLV
jgi:hypothetical protein